MTYLNWKFCEDKQFVLFFVFVSIWKCQILIGLSINTITIRFINTDHEMDIIIIFQTLKRKKWQKKPYLKWNWILWNIIWTQHNTYNNHKSIVHGNVPENSCYCFITIGYSWNGKKHHHFYSCLYKLDVVFKGCKNSNLFLFLLVKIIIIWRKKTSSLYEFQKWPISDIQWWWQSDQKLPPVPSQKKRSNTWFLCLMCACVCLVFND